MKKLLYLSLLIFLPSIVFAQATKYGGAGSGNTSPGGSNTHIQYNDNGTFAGESNFNYDPATDILQVDQIDIPASATTGQCITLKEGSDNDSEQFQICADDSMDQSVTINASDMFQNGDAVSIDAYTTGELSGKRDIDDMAATASVATRAAYKGLVTNTGAGGATVYTLPTAVKGMDITFLLTVAQDVDIEPQSADIITLGATALDAGDKLSSDSTIGSSIRLVSQADGKWIAMAANTQGTWSDAGAGGGGCAYILCEGFEGTGYENVWNPAGDTVNPDYTTTVLVGTQSLFTDRITSFTYAVHTLASTRTSLYGYFQMRLSSLSSSVLSRVRDAANATLFQIEITGVSPTNMKISSGAGTATGSVSLAADTTYHVWWDWDDDSGAGDGSGSIYIATTDTKPSADATFSNGDKANDADDVLFGTSQSGNDVIYDKIRLHSSTIGSGPS